MLHTVSNVHTMSCLNMLCTDTNVHTMSCLDMLRTDSSYVLHQKIRTPAVTGISG